MRLYVTLEVGRETSLPVNYQHLLTAVVYDLLGSADAEYARFLHDSGYGGEGGRRFKLFTFSWLRGRGRVLGPTIVYAQGQLTWFLSSPVDEFVQHLATGLLTAGVLRVGSASLPIQSVGTLPSHPETKEDQEPSRFTCLSPLVASVPRHEGHALYLKPSDGPEFSEAIRRNLIQKYRLLHGSDPENTTFEMLFDQAYLARSGGGTKLITYKEIQIRAAFAPFTVTGSPALISLGYEAGFGEKNAGVFGMVEKFSSRVGIET